MKGKILLLIICILMVTVSIGCKSTGEKEEKNSSQDKETTIKEVAQENSEEDITQENPKKDSEEPSKPTYTTELVENVTPSTSTTTPSTQKSVKDLDLATQTDQLILVAVNGTNATFSMYTKNTDGSWKTIVSTDSCYIGRDGLGKTKEGNMQTPTGAYRFTKAFGIKSNPGTQLDYTMVDNSHYWVDDPDSRYYNQFVSINDVRKDWTSAEHIVEYTSQYKYCLSLDYNKECIPGEGSAIFLHCTNYRATGGCIAIPEQDMIQVLKNINTNCVIIIDTKTNIWNY